MFLSADARDGLSQQRAGFWRRAIAWLIDVLVIFLIGSIILAIPFALLFAATNGAVQYHGFNFSKCVAVPLKVLPESLNPPPPADANFAVDCRYSAFGLADTARELMVGKISEVKQGLTSTTTFIGEKYGLGADGLPRRMVSLKGGEFLLFLLYLVVLQSRYGATAGMALLKIRVMNIESPGSVGIPPLKAFIRPLVLFAGSIPFWAYLIWMAAHSNNALAEATATGFTPPPVLVLIWAAYVVWIIVDIVRRRDPVYDRIAKTAVVLTAPAAPSHDLGIRTA